VARTFTARLRSLRELRRVSGMSGGSASVKSDLPVLGVAAMTTEIAVSPAMSLADRGSPERFAPDSPDDTADHRAGRSGDKKTRSGARHCTDRIRLRRRNPERSGKNCRRHQQFTHHVTPRPALLAHPNINYHTIPFHKVDGSANPRSCRG